jgi:glycosyltransferase involved in cell wall biosynthesis
MTRISIGLPVYNGEAYLKQALDSLLQQTHTDFEVILSDNASTDATGMICEEYAAADDRIRYVRQPVNRGGAFNHNFVLAQATAPYFRMFSYDDWMEPTCLEACARVLDEDPDVVLAWTETTMVDEEGRTMGYRTDQVWDDRRPSTRLASLIGPAGADSLLQWSAPLYGVARRADFAASYRLSYGGSDLEATVKLALRGHWRRIPDPLFHRRQHASNSSSGRTVHTMITWMDPAARPGRSLPNFRRRLGYLDGVLHTPMSRRERLRCLVVVSRVFLRPRDVRQLVWDIRVLVRELVTERRPGRRGSVVPEPDVPTIE